jgi:protein-tyrosine phosphatase
LSKEVSNEREGFLMTLTLPTFQFANATFVTPFLAVGGDLDMYSRGLATRQAAELSEKGISHILDVRQECSDELVWEQVSGMEYRWDGIDDAGQRVPVEWFEGIATWALKALEDSNARLLTHCHMGINRGPSAGYAVLLGLGWQPLAALDAIRVARPIAYVAYAEDALRWHHWRTGATTAQRKRDLAAVARWRQENHLDVAYVIRAVRAQEAE